MIHSLTKHRRAVVGSCVLLGLLILMGGCSQEEPVKKGRYDNIGLRPVPEYLKDTIYERCNLENTEPWPVSAYGLVVNLPGTGGNQGIPRTVRDYMLDELTRHGFGQATSDDAIRRMTPTKMLDDQKRRTAVVKVVGHVPPGARAGQVMDLNVEALPDSEVTSLQRGVLYRTSLRQRGADPFNPRGSVNIYAIGEGDVFVNPIHAADGGADSSTARASLRSGTVLGRAVCVEDRPLILLLRTPEYRIAGAIQERIRLAFPPDSTDPKQRAAARDEGIVDLYVPRSMASDWQHYANVAMHLYLNGTAEFRAAKARELAAEARKPEITSENLSHISYAWEGLGKPALEVTRPLYNHPRPEVAFFSARAGAFLGDLPALQALLQIAQTEGHLYQLTAVRSMGALPQSPRVQRTLDELLDSPNSLIRITAYRILTSYPSTGRFITLKVGHFTLDMIPSNGPAMVYAWRVGQARVAVFGKSPALRLPIMFTALDQTFTISSAEKPGMVKIVYAGPDVPQVISTLSTPMLHEVIRHLGGATEAGFRFSYADVVGILYKLAQKDLPATFVLQDAPRVRSIVDDAPAIPDLGASVASGAAPANPPAVGVAPSIGIRPDAATIGPERPATQPTPTVNVPSIGVR